VKKLLITYIFLQLFALLGFARVTSDDVSTNSDVVEMLNDTIKEQPLETPLTGKWINKENSAADTVQVTSLDKEKFKPNPMRSIWMGAAIPGFGQIVNRKYWKLPIVYGGFLGFAYAISWNNSTYNTYKNAYRDMTDSDPTTNSHIKILPRGYTIAMIGETTYQNILKSKQDSYHQYRDLSIILSVGYYAVVLLDAYVDAQLYDFDISPDLVLNVQPTRIQKENHSPAAYGLHFSVNF